MYGYSQLSRLSKLLNTIHVTNLFSPAEPVYNKLKKRFAKADQVLRHKMDSWAKDRQQYQRYAWRSFSRDILGVTSLLWPVLEAISYVAQYPIFRQVIHECLLPNLAKISQTSYPVTPGGTPLKEKRNVNSRVGVFSLDTNQRFFNNRAMGPIT